MSEEYNVFGNLDALCNNNFLAKFKSKPHTHDDSNDEYHSDNNSLEDFLTTTSGNKKQAKTKKKPAASESELSTDSISPTCLDLLPPPSKRPSPKKQNEKIVAVPVAQRSTGGHTRRSRKSLNLEEVPEPAQIDPQAVQGKRGRGRKKQNHVDETAATVTAAVAPATVTHTNAPNLNHSNPIHRMYNLRSHAAMVATMSKIVDYVDLVSSPVPRIEGVINIDDDEEETTTHDTSTPVEKNNLLDLSFDEENPEISVKIIWNGKPQIFKLRKYQKFSHIFSLIAEREKTDEKNLVFNINSKIINANETPASINYKIYEFINGRILVSKFNSPIAPLRQKRDANKIFFKIQSDKWKRPLKVELLKTDKLKILYIKCAEELNIPYENLKLSFDGETLEFNHTAADVDLEGGEAIDLRIKK